MSGTHATPTNRDTGAALFVISLYSVVAAAVFLAVDGLPPRVALPLALPLLLFGPGYAVMTALFPPVPGGPAGPNEGGGDRPTFARLERFVLAVVLSIALVPMVALVANFVTGVVAGPVLAGVAGVTVVAAAVAIVRTPSTSAVGARDLAGQRRRVGEGAALAWDRLTANRITLPAVVLAVLLLAASAAVANPGADDGGASTAFYLADAGDGPPHELRVANHGDAARRYTIVVVPATDSGGSTELERVTLTVEAGDVGAASIDESGGTLRFLLYRGDAPADPAAASAFRVLEVSSASA